ncbi:hypothetical protein TBLA_0B07250 [Henningerozyma blattae CBS 6284]|uniref:Mitochondrial carrier protein n=1 Tax=Henningerozyma blattae (strain ATCC 34711 / CBS 6284 / DSM 70876 / NBRC 10599 / NRRL Y-10934 / UCD 77-7) TaxID=1071380 RepID=I2GZJ1_HENB6|nr:hypothetical protein TBLA_0B07250 [Tetrapisispora blattae CBS 6284]CCH59543.1 hypothetical protein TBLA_0B07250 [Tetrapisispora blattae CBS 6284]
MLSPNPDIPQPQPTDPPLHHNTIAGVLSCLIADTTMHPLDTLKTRQQGSSQNVSLYSYFIKLSRQEGFRGFYSGYSAALSGSIPSAAVFFTTYEFIKRELRPYNEPISFLIGGLMGDLLSSVVYVPSEVIKTRLQLQGKFSNPFYVKNYNYRNFRSAIKSIWKVEGRSTFFWGYGATLGRDLPFSALQFAFYEELRKFCIYLKNQNQTNPFGLNISNNNKNDNYLPLSLELLTGGIAGGLAGAITTPLDVVKTRKQTQSNFNGSLYQNLLSIKTTQGYSGLFSGIGARCVWTSVQSSIMLVVYQFLLREIDSPHHFKYLHS